MRANKKKGLRSKKELREEVCWCRGPFVKALLTYLLRVKVQAEATQKLKEISVKHSCVSGKWYVCHSVRSVCALRFSSHEGGRLIFAPPDKVDMIWSSIASASTMSL